MDAVYALLDKGIDIDGKGVPGYPPLMSVAARGDVEATRQLLARGADVHRVIGLGCRTALYFALQMEHFACARLLVEAGSDVNSSDPSRETLLMAAASRDSVEGVRFLIEAGADMNVRDDTGRTVLERATWSQTSFWNDPRVATYWKGQEGNRDFDTMRNKNREIIAVLRQAGAIEERNNP